MINVLNGTGWDRIVIYGVQRTGTTYYYKFRCLFKRWKHNPRKIGQNRYRYRKTVLFVQVMEAQPLSPPPLQLFLCSRLEYQRGMSTVGEAPHCCSAVFPRAFLAQSRLAIAVLFAVWLGGEGGGVSSFADWFTSL